MIITSIVVAGTSSAISNRFGAFSKVGGIIGTSVSAAFLIILGILNSYICFKLVQQMRRLIRTSPEEVRSSQGSFQLGSMLASNDLKDLEPSAH